MVLACFLVKATNFARIMMLPTAMWSFRYFSLLPQQTFDYNNRTCDVKYIYSHIFALAIVLIGIVACVVSHTPGDLPGPLFSGFIQQSPLTYSGYPQVVSSNLYETRIEAWSNKDRINAYIGLVFGIYIMVMVSTHAHNWSMWTFC